VLLTLMAHGAVALDVRQVTVRYGPHRVLDDVSLHAAGGELVALLGASGCGKTTLLRAICGFVELASGSILLDGRDISRLLPDKRNIAMVFQSYALWPHMTVAQNMGYGLKLRGVSRADIGRRIDELLAMLRLNGLAERKVTALSGGQRQRVALGRALAINPQVLLLDEPLSNLDARVREEVRDEIRTLQQRLQITAVHVTHDRQEAMVMADRLVILDGGRVAQSGTPEEIYRTPNSPFVASFMGATNIIRLHLTREGDRAGIAAGPCNDAIEFDATACRGAEIGSIANDAQVAVHFRGEDARLCPPIAPPDGFLILRGQVAQRSYPGGFYRYAIKVGPYRYQVDDQQRLAIGEPVCAALPLDALHFFAAPAGPPANTKQPEQGR
jgi:putative spermidine/putrescine transport system ATP-binding protein